MYIKVRQDGGCNTLPRSGRLREQPPKVLQHWEVRPTVSGCRAPRDTDDGSRITNGLVGVACQISQMAIRFTSRFVRYV